MIRCVSQPLGFPRRHLGLVLRALPAAVVAPRVAERVAVVEHGVELVGDEVVGSALPFIDGELEFDRCPVAVSRLGPPTSKSFDQPAKDRRRFPHLKNRGEIGDVIHD